MRAPLPRNLHLHDVDTRIQRAFDRIRPYLGSCAGGVSYLGVTARPRMDCSRSAGGPLPRPAGSPAPRWPGVSLAAIRPGTGLWRPEGPSFDTMCR